MGQRPQQSSARCLALRQTPPKPAVLVGVVHTKPRYNAYEVTDLFGRKIRFYLSQLPNPRQDISLPIALFIQGSGCHSLFRLDEHQKLRAGYQHVLLKAGEGRIRLLAVEKPGVKFLDWPGPRGTAIRCSREFHREHTLERWVIALEAALHAALLLPMVEPEPVMVAGHSEGGLVAATLSNRCAYVTHIGVLASSAATQIYELIATENRVRQAKEKAASGGLKSGVISTLKKIQRDPLNDRKLVWGHPFRRWSSFLATSTLEQLLQTKACIFAAHGTADQVVPIDSFDAMVGRLRENGVAVTVDRLANRNHSFNQEGEKSVEGMQAVLTRFLAWALTNH